MLPTVKTVKMKAASRKDLNELIATLSKVRSERGQWSKERIGKICKILIEACRAIRTRCRNSSFARTSMA